MSQENVTLTITRAELDDIMFSLLLSSADAILRVSTAETETRRKQAQAACDATVALYDKLQAIRAK